MILPCFKLSIQPENSCGRIFKNKTPSVGDLPGAGDVADWVDWKSREKEGLPDWAKKDTASKLATVKTTVDTTDKLRKVKEKVDKEREKVQYRPRLDIFGTIECQEWYLNGVRESLETLAMGDKLHDFIMAHPKYALGQHVKWNDDFATMIQLDVPQKYRGAAKAIMQKRIAVAAQQVMADHFNSDLFKIVSENGWDKEDGKVGPYTTRVLREYWVNVHQKASKKEPQPPTASELGRGYPKSGINARHFAAAITTLATLMASAKPDVVVPKEKTPPEVELAKKVADRNTKAKEKYAKLDKAGDEVKVPAIKKQAFDIRTPLLTALGIVFEERPSPGAPQKSPKTYRLMNLLAQKEGALVDRMQVEPGDQLEITRDGHLIVYQSNGAKRYNKKFA